MRGWEIGEVELGQVPAGVAAMVCNPMRPSSGGCITLWSWTLWVCSAMGSCPSGCITLWSWILWSRALWSRAHSSQSRWATSQPPVRSEPYHFSHGALHWPEKMRNQAPRRLRHGPAQTHQTEGRQSRAAHSTTKYLTGPARYALAG